MNPLVSDVDHTLGVRVAKVALVRQSEVDLTFIQRVGDLVREDTCRETGYDFLHLHQMCGVENVVIDECVVSKECQLEVATTKSINLAPCRCKQDVLLYISCS